MTAEDVKILPLKPGPLVLVVDDEARSRSTITRMVASLGYQARSCHDGRAALRFLKAHPREVRLLLADLGMPHMDGGELAERAKDLDPRLTAVLMADPEDVSCMTSSRAMPASHSSRSEATTQGVISHTSTPDDLTQQSLNVQIHLTPVGR